jgi:methionyl-tRNA formyltransferase
MARVFLISSHYMGVLYVDELLRAGDEIVGAAALPGDGGWIVPPEYDFRAKCFREYIPVYEPEPKLLNSPEFVRVMRRLEPDYVISGYYPRIFKDEILSLPRYGCINIHPTGLPRFRGLSPYFTHVLFGDTHNRITMHWLNPGIDTGDIIAQAATEILPEDTGFTSGHKNTEAAGRMFREYWPLVKEGRAPRQVQDESIASVFNFNWKIAEIDWKKSNVEIWNLVRTLTRPFDGAWTLIAGRKLHVFKVRPVPEGEEMPVSGAMPGEVLAVTGKGFWVQCGQGQVEIVDSTLDDAPGKPVAEVLPAPGAHLRILLG